MYYLFNICEDIWYPGGPAREQALVGNAELIVNISSSPFHDGKGLMREQMIATRAADHGAVLAFCNLVGGQDELVFDGGSLVIDQTGSVIARAPRFEEHLLVVDIDIEAVFRHRLHDPRRRKEKQTAESGALPIVLGGATGRPPEKISENPIHMMIVSGMPTLRKSENL